MLCSSVFMSASLLELFYVIITLFLYVTALFLVEDIFTLAFPADSS